MTSKRSQENILAIRGIDRELWKWLKARAALEGKTAAEVINGLIERYNGPARRRKSQPVNVTHIRHSPSGESTGNCGNGSRNVLSSKILLRENLSIGWLDSTGQRHGPMQNCQCLHMHMTLIT